MITERFTKRKELGSLLEDLMNKQLDEIRERKRENPSEGVYEFTRDYFDIFRLYEKVTPNSKVKRFRGKYSRAIEGK